jgi:hypothetical protein
VCASAQTDRCTALLWINKKKKQTHLKYLTLHTSGVSLEYIIVISHLVVGFCVSANWISVQVQVVKLIEGPPASISRVPGAKGQEDTNVRIEAVLLQTLTAVLQMRQTLSLIVSNLHQRLWTNKAFSLHQSSWHETLLSSDKSLICSAHALSYSLLTNLPTMRIFTYISRTSS